jgi:hypothetical protein
MTTPYAAELIQNAKAIGALGKGILAADESTGTIGQRFAGISMYLYTFLHTNTCIWIQERVYICIQISTCIHTHMAISPLTCVNMYI